MQSPCRYLDEVGVVVAAQAMELRQAEAFIRAESLPIRMPSGPRPAPSRASHGIESPLLESRQPGYTGRQVVMAEKSFVAEHDPVLSARRFVSRPNCDADYQRCVLCDLGRASVNVRWRPSSRQPSKRRICGMITHLAGQRAAYPGPEIPPDPDLGAADEVGRHV
jgi:hypothetical protein